jgi:hypothetical protein
MVLDTPGTMLFSMVRTDAREELFKWVGPIAPHTDVLISMAGSGNEITEITDLNNYFTGVVEGFSSLDLLLNHWVLRSNIVIYDDMKALYKALRIPVKSSISPPVQRSSADYRVAGLSGI